MYSSGIARYHPLHDSESQKQQAQHHQLQSHPSRSRFIRLIDPRARRSYIAHALCALAHIVMLAVALHGWSMSETNGFAEKQRIDIPAGAFVVASIVAVVNCILVLFTAPLETHIISVPVREFSAARYIIYYLGGVFCAGTVIVDFKYAVRAGIHATGWGHMLNLELCAIAAGLVSFYVVAVDGLRVYQAYNVAQVCATVPKIKVEDVETKLKHASLMSI
jgi:hypothetical protein